MHHPKGIGVVLFLLLAVGVLAPSPARAQDKEEDWAQKLVESEDREARIEAGIKLGARDPDALAEALDKVIKAKREGDVGVLATIAVKTKVIHVRYLLVWAASRLDGTAAAFREKIDNDHPWESLRAIEALGLLKDKDSADVLITQLRNENEMVALEAARSLGRIGDKKLANPLIEATLQNDNRLVRTQAAWAVQDVLGSRKGAISAFARFSRKKGTEGFRAKEAVGILGDELANPQSYKVKLDVVRKLFAKRGGAKTPRVEGPTENQETFNKVLELMKKDTPDYWHLVTVACSEITVTGNEQMFDFDTGKLNFRFRDLSAWEGREELYAYYLVRYATIMFTAGKMGEAREGQRGWEKGIMEAYWYAMDYTKLALDEDPAAFYKSVINMRPAPW